MVLVFTHLYRAAGKLMKAGKVERSRRRTKKAKLSMFKPKYITFDCYGTLTRFRISDMIGEFFADRIAADRMDAFVADCSAYRFDEVLGAWKPYADVISDSLERTCRLWGVEFRRDEARAIYDAVPTWGPHADVPEPLARVAEHFPLVILSNASNSQIHHNVAKLGAPFHAVYTAEQAQAYKPRFRRACLRQSRPRSRQPGLWLP
jgi:2-haloacid dehalogenase